METVGNLLNDSGKIIDHTSPWFVGRKSFCTLTKLCSGMCLWLHASSGMDPSTPTRMDPLKVSPWEALLVSGGQLVYGIIWTGSHTVCGWFCYVDDTFEIWSHREELGYFLDHFNSVHPRIHFTMEKEVATKLAFLDVLVLKRANGSIGHCV